MYDVIVIGMGPAGMNAALYAKRSGLNVIMFEKSSPGGLISKMNIVDNYLGYENIAGSDLATKMFFHTQEQEIPYKIEEVENIIVEDNKKVVVTSEGSYETKAIILCGGRRPRKINVEDEEKLEGKGISYCAICDAPLYKGKKVAVVGGGNSAFEEGLYLSDFASKVIILNRGETCRADKVLQDEVKEKSNMEVRINSKIKEILLEDDKIEGVLLEDGEKLEVSGIFVYVGFEPSTDYISKLGILTEDNYISVDQNMRTKIKGIYAAGDTIKKSLYQIITAASEGATAAISVKNDIKDL